MKIDSVTRAIVDPQLRDSFPNGANIAWIAADDAFNLGLKNALALRAPLASEPTRKLLRTAN
jgi:hypothetical protein